MIEEKQKKQIPVYERLGPKECLIMYKSKDDLLVACNEDGKLEVKRIPIPDKKK